MADSGHTQRGSLDWIESTLVRIIEAAMLGDSNEMDEPDGDTGKNFNLARLACMDLAKLKGYIIERKQVKTASASIRIDTLNRQQL